MKLAILDDYANLALRLADWSGIASRCSIQVFNRTLAADEQARVLEPFDIICHMRERMAMPSTLIERLPNLKFIAITGRAHRTLDLAAAARRGIVVSASPTRGTGLYSTPELAWGLILCTARHISFEDRKMHVGGWQNTAGMALFERTLGLLGLGLTGQRMAEYGKAFGMRVIAWSQNLTAEAASKFNVTRVEKEELFRQSDALSIHVVLSDRTRGLVGSSELALMKPTAVLINTSRGPIVREEALVAALAAGKLRGAGLDVYDTEPLPDDSPLRRLENVVLTPHLGYASEDALRTFYEDTVAAVQAYLDGKPVRVVTPSLPFSLTTRPQPLS